MTPKTSGTIDSPKVDTYDLWAWNSVSKWTSFMVYVNMLVGEILVYSIPQNGNPTKKSLRCRELSVVAFRKWRPISVTCLQESVWRYLLLLVRSTFRLKVGALCCWPKSFPIGSRISLGLPGWLQVTLTGMFIDSAQIWCETEWGCPECGWCVKFNVAYIRELCCKQNVWI